MSEEFSVNNNDFQEVLRALTSPRVINVLNNIAVPGGSCSPAINRQFGSVEEEIQAQFRARVTPNLIQTQIPTQASPRLSLSQVKQRRTARQSVVRDKFPSFKLTVILLCKSKVKTIPKNLIKKRMIENGLVISSVAFQKKWTEDDVRKEIVKLFPNNLSGVLEFDFWKSADVYLAPVILAVGEEFNGQTIWEEWNRRILYICPHKEIKLPKDDIPNSINLDSSLDESDDELPDVHLKEDKQDGN